MTPEQIALVQSSWIKVAPIADQAADIFYDRLFEVAPETRPLFAEDMTRQKRALMGMLATAVNSLNRLDAILPAVEALGVRHVSYGVKDEHYDIVGEALLYTLSKGLGDEFTPPVKAAWSEAYSALAGAMKAAAAKTAKPTSAGTASAGALKQAGFFEKLFGRLRSAR